MWTFLITTTLALLIALLAARWSLQKFLDSAYEN
jgi:hypothetical protein